MSENGLLGFVFPSGDRDTISLIQGCVLTVVVCSWASTHLNVPSDSDSEWTMLRRRAKWVLIAMIAPEYVAFIALRQWYEVHWIQERLNNVIKQLGSKLKDLRPMGLTLIGAGALSSRSLFKRGSTYGQGKLMLDQDGTDPERLQSLDRVKSTSSSLSPAGAESSKNCTQELGENQVAHLNDGEEQAVESVVHLSVDYAYFIYMGGFRVRFSDNTTFRLNALQFLDLLKNELIDLPPLDTEMIRAFSKADVFAKLLACLNIIWFLALLISRFKDNLPITPLELFTAAQIICSLTNYIAWLRKPHIEVPISISFKGSPEKRTELQENNVLTEHLNGYRVANNDTIDRDKTGMKTFPLCALLPTLVFGAFHLVGWHAHFATTAEMYLWRTASVCCLVLPLAIVGLSNLTLRGHVPWLRPGWMVLVCLYVAFRAFIFAEMLAGLRQVPAGVYVINYWTKIIPHLGG